MIDADSVRDKVGSGFHPGVLVGVGVAVLVAVTISGVDEGLGVTVGVATTAGPQATNVNINNKLSLFMFSPTLKRIRQSVNLPKI
jgi:hypothetical protein